MLSSVDVDIHNTKKEALENVSNLNKVDEVKTEAIVTSSPKNNFSFKQLLIIIIPITTVILFAVIFIPVYVVNKNNDDDDKDDKVIINNNNYYIYDEHDEYDEVITNETYATLTPKDGYDNIFIFLGGITEFANNYFDFFKGRNTFIPKGTKIYSISGQIREMQYMIDYGAPPQYTTVPGWFNVDKFANLVPENDFTQAKESLKIVLDEIDRIKTEENIDYKNIYLGGFSQGAVMTNYVLLNSRHELGGYIAFSGYVFDHDLSANTVIYNLSPTQQSKIDSRKDYHILATHSFNDDRVFYKNSAESYQEYYKKYTDFKLLSFGELEHYFETQPIFPEVRKWLRKRMNK